MKLKQIYEDTVVPKLMEEFGITNKMAVPRILKVVVNTGVKEGASDKGVIEKAAEQIAVITGQRAKVARAKKSIANFKLREGAPIGLAVTLRGTRMYDFLTKLINIVLPKVRDFQGVADRSFDTNGNYTLGLTEQVVFPEIEYGKIDKIRGLEITIVMQSGDSKISKRLLELLGLPFRKESTSPPR
ncbi:50S ribosomal protein L5 [Candidatus Amesbacteria bacterium]|nr:50S ribosomal protein L5 [Candidatus Amesbacteria bacterium]